MRAFFCIPLGVGQRTAIASIAERFRGATRMRASWVRPENYHLTVRFLGEIDPILTVDLDQVCRGVAESVDPFAITFDRLGAFPAAERARVLWVGGETPAEYINLVTSLNEQLRPLGFGPEWKRPVAHVTVARIKSVPDPDLGRLLEAPHTFPSEPARVDRVALMESRLTPEGAVYSPLFEVRLGVER